MEIPESVLKIAGHLRDTLVSESPDAAVILGSGLGQFTEEMEDVRSLAYSEIPGFPQTSVAGHDGRLSYGLVGKKRVIAFSGRFHIYEGYPLEKTVFPVQLTSALGTSLLVVSNAAGGINFRYRIGDLMLIDDLLHIGYRLALPGKQQPIQYKNDELVERVRLLAEKNGMYVQRGCYVYSKGPTYETAAEIRAFRSIGGDAVGMSTAAELLEARRLDLKNIGISLISNMATGVSTSKLDHSEIKEAAKLRKQDFASLVGKIIRKFA